MSKTVHNLGKLLTRHGTSPVYLQRAAFIAILSFAFFLAVLAAFYIRQQIGYFLMSVGFLIVHLFTLTSWWKLQHSNVRIYEFGIVFRKFEARWDEITSVRETNDRQLEVLKADNDKVILPGSLIGYEQIERQVRSAVNAHS
ncbi:MAG: hypothetical protein WBD22_10190 [Pyrinomonadaceae bacterium]